jgi:hypothetical protein
MVKAFVGSNPTPRTLKEFLIGFLSPCKTEDSNLFQRRKRLNRVWMSYIRQVSGMVDYLDVVDKDDQVTGRETRNRIHGCGL